MFSLPGSPIFPRKLEVEKRSQVILLKRTKLFPNSVVLIQTRRIFPSNKQLIFAKVNSICVNLLQSVLTAITQRCAEHLEGDGK